MAQSSADAHGLLLEKLADVQASVTVNQALGLVLLDSMAEILARMDGRPKDDVAVELKTQMGELARQLGTSLSQVRTGPAEAPPEARYCPICEREAQRFEPFGAVPREEAKCPHCGSLERHRLVWYYFTHHTDLLTPPRKRMLHVAPEAIFAKKFQASEQIDYLSADLLNPRAMVQMDLTDIQYPDDSFDVIYCSHVLEHVPDDRKAMRELARVLAPGGWSILQVPITVAETFEDPSVTDPAERLRLFGQEDHVRRYGPDYKDRLEEAGFEVILVPATDLLSQEDIDRMRIHAQEVLYICLKPAA